MISGKVLIVLGSDSDLETIAVTRETLNEFDIAHEVRIASAHRSPDHTAALLRGAKQNGFAVVIAAAGLAAHLSGVCAAHTLLPVIAIPLDRSSLGGRDSLYASVMMPAGVPVAAVAIDKPGAKNAALLAVRILALSDQTLHAKLETYAANMTAAVLEKDKKLVAKQNSQS
ncbi:N5-carboxyaminoimidazole ribonucleotide mutase [Spirochaetota bacterium]|nr:N5-carboxyaminoimidazole ribonucleotide mutase [Spirochaetota bacterium]